MKKFSLALLLMIQSACASSRGAPSCECNPDMHTKVWGCACDGVPLGLTGPTGMSGLKHDTEESHGKKYP
jgi:hypothetical protein